MRLEQVEGQLWPDNPHYPRTRLLCLENTHNRGGGRVQPYEVVEESLRLGPPTGLRTHLDGARLFNAVVASGIPGARWAATLRHGQRLLSARGLVLPGRLGTGRPAGDDPRSAPPPQSCSAAACGRRACWPRRRSTPWITTSSAWPRTTPTPSDWPPESAKSPGTLGTGDVDTNLVWFEVENRKLGGGPRRMAPTWRSRACRGPAALRHGSLDVSAADVEAIVAVRGKNCLNEASDRLGRKDGQRRNFASPGTVSAFLLTGNPVIKRLPD